MNLFRTVIFLLTSIAVLPALSAEAGDSVSNRQDYKVGLVLSGGGAKGIAHVGVIKALEENDIAIDCIAGTSMGAIVGSLYACGWSPEQMMSFFTSRDFSYWSTGVINPADIMYFSRPDPSPAWLRLNLALDKEAPLKGALPSNLISPLPMNIEFLRLYAPYSRQCSENFDRLFVPLRTVCSDVYHKHKIVCSSGSLGDAVRASMSFPMVFKPIEMDGVLVYDGGIYDNFPVDVMQKDFNPDFIIGVSVSGPDEKPVAGNAFSQLEDMIIQNNDYSLPPEAGVKIQVPVLQFGVLDFDKADVIYDIGYRTGLQMVDSIKKRCPRFRPVGEVNARRRSFAKATPDLYFDDVQVEGTTPGQTRYIKDLFYSGKRPHPVGMDRVQRAYYRAVTGGKVQDMLPQYTIGPDNRNNLLLKTTPKNPWQVGIGGWITTSTQSMLYLDLGYHTLRFNSLDLDLQGWVGQSYYAGRLAARFSISGRIPSFIEAELVASRQKYYSSELLFYQDRTPTFISDSQGFLRLSYCRALGMKNKLTASLAGGLLRDRYFSYDVQNFAGREKDRTSYHGLNVSLDFRRSTLDNDMYPMAGEYLDANILGMLENSDYFPQGDKSLERDYGNHLSLSGQVTYRRFFPLHKNFRLGVSGFALLTLRKLYQDYTATLVHSAAFAPTPATRNYFNMAFRSDNFVAAGLTPVWNPFGKFQLRGDFYAYAPLRDIAPDGPDRCRFSGWLRRAEFIGEVAAVYNFPFASISLYGNYLTAPARNWNFGLCFGLYFQAPRFAR